MGYQELCKKYFRSVDETINNAVLGIKVQLSEGNNEEFFNLCSAIKDTEEDLNNMAKEIGKLSKRLMDVGEFDYVIAYQEIQYKLEDLIFELVFFAETSLKYNDTEVDITDLNEKFNLYVEIKEKYNL
ncbi:hypothetical protein ACQPUY_15515 [Clostridium nigeriense]|uniref:hypothetical protein n=1 Tax=Clostridium nigeriense TaxID=1805470 RepID=UPI003D33E9FF